MDRGQKICPRRRSASRLAGKQLCRRNGVGRPRQGNVCPPRRRFLDARQKGPAAAGFAIFQARNEMTGRSWRLPTGSENAYHSRWFRFRPGNPGSRQKRPATDAGDPQTERMIVMKRTTLAALLLTVATAVPAFAAEYKVVD